MEFPFSLDAASVAPFVSALAVAAPIGWLAIRGRSFFPVRYRLWRLMHRKDDVGVEWLDKSVHERVELMKCRALLIWADSHPQAKRIEEWAAERGVDLGTLGECGNYFDRVKLSLREKLPNLSKVQKTALLFGYFFCLVFVGGASLASSDEAMASFKGSGHWFYLTTVAAHPISSPHYSAMTRDDCTKGDDPAGFKADRAVTCDILRDPHLSGYVEQNVRGEHVTGIAVCALSVFMLWLLYRWTVALRSSHAVHHQLRLHAEKNRPVASAEKGEQESR